MLRRFLHQHVLSFPSSLRTVSTSSHKFSSTHHSKLKTSSLSSTVHSPPMHLRRLNSVANTLVILHPHGESRLTLDLLVSIPGFSLQCSFLRDVSDPVSQTLRRFALKLQRESSLQASTGTVPWQLSKIDLLDERHEPLAQNLPNGIALKQCKHIQFTWQDKSREDCAEKQSLVSVSQNIPTVTSIRPPRKVFVGVPCSCGHLVIRFVNRESQQIGKEPTAVQQPSGTSHQSDHPSLLKKQQEPKENTSSSSKQSDAIARHQPPSTTSLNYQWRLDDGTLLSHNRVLVPKAEWTGRKLFFRVIPADHPGALWCEIETPKVLNEVQRFTEPPRWAQLRPCPEKACRAVSYNILHDGYCQVATTRAKFYPHCTDDILDVDFRVARILQELDRYRPSILGLQEVGLDLFRRYLHNALLHQGLDVIHAPKTNGLEGGALAWNPKRFSLLPRLALGSNDNSHSNELTNQQKTLFVTADRSLSDLSQTHYLEYLTLDWDHFQKHYPDMARDVSENFPHLEEGLRLVTTSACIIALKDLRDQSELLLVANTHLYYHENGDHIRALQAWMLTMALQSLAERVEQSNIQSISLESLPSKTPSLVLLGDWNSKPDSGAYRLLTTGELSSLDPCWRTAGLAYWQQTKWENSERNQGNSTEDKNNTSGSSSPSDPRLHHPPTSFYAPTLSSPFSLHSSFHQFSSELPHTIFSLDFQEPVDHCFVSKDIRMDWTLPVPSASELETNVALPSSNYPSDHLAIVTDLLR